MKAVFSAYLRTPLLMRIFAGFLLGSLVGIGLWYAGTQDSDLTARVIPYVQPFGSLLVSLLKMIVVPVILLSLITGAASLPLARFGKIGVKVIAWYLLCSFLAAVIGTLVALAFNPGEGSNLAGWERLVGGVKGEAESLVAQADSNAGPMGLLLSMFENPFHALSEGHFLAIIVFAIFFGLALRVLLDGDAGETQKAAVQRLLDSLEAARDAVFKMVDWILEYTPVGVFALSVVNFGLYGPSIAGPYVNVTLGVITGVLVMVLVVYPALLWISTRRNPLQVYKYLQEPMITAFITRSSAATLPVSLRVIEHDLKVKNELASFSLPLGATINMDGVCVHLPMFAILAANIFGVDLSATQLLMLVLTTVLASIGAGGVPGGSLMLLFIILQAMGLAPEQIAVIVALALGINPILDMFETCNNVTGDLVCTYAVAERSGLVDQPSPSSADSAPAFRPSPAE
ncbi:dicarboxylate/amino acid:cation symporter [Pseudomonas indica]|uniref:dicarboxylate/amino acid:cation symporter n=1 Tax=Pseudomonas indica TaxID=137658 RepID=UPI0023F6D725|nr:dicarboxylate/amino acid:cation symporter [Pseudomonas indica]MBU3055976.1 dicarboxylate/amino acid:cation symporter [Pseudomonas indica]